MHIPGATTLRLWTPNKKGKNFDEGSASSSGGSKKKGCGSKAATAVVDLQRQLPQARVLYASATGASAIGEMGFLQRMGLWGVGHPSMCDYSAFKKSFEKLSSDSMELIASHLTKCGSYIARTLSYEAADFEVITSALTAAQRSQYDTAARVWQEMYQVLEETGQRASFDEEFVKMLGQKKKTFWVSTE